MRPRFAAGLLALNRSSLARAAIGEVSVAGVTLIATIVMTQGIVV